MTPGEMAVWAASYSAELTRQRSEHPEVQSEQAQLAAYRAVTLLRFGRVYSAGEEFRDEIVGHADKRSGGPAFNHTRADGPYDPCPECLERMSREQLLALAKDRRGHYELLSAASSIVDEWRSERSLGWDDVVEMLGKLAEAVDVARGDK